MQTGIWTTEQRSTHWHTRVYRGGVPGGLPLETKFSAFFCVFSFHFFSFLLFLPFSFSLSPSLPPFLFPFLESNYQRNNTSLLKLWNMGLQFVGDFFYINKEEHHTETWADFWPEFNIVTGLRKCRKSPFSPNSVGCNTLLSRLNRENSPFATFMKIRDIKQSTVISSRIFSSLILDIGVKMRISHNNTNYIN